MGKLKALCLNGLDDLFAIIKRDYVKKEVGKVLSTNDFTTAEKDKLSKLSEPTITTVKLNNSPLVPDGQKAVNIDLTNYATKSDISSVYKYKGTVATYSLLPTGANVGDTYNIEQADASHNIKAGDNVSWNGKSWDVLAGTVDLSGYALKTELSNKVDKVDGKVLSTNDFTTAEKQKLANLNNYSHPTSDGNKHVPANGTTNGGKFLQATATAGVYQWADVTMVEEITKEEIEASYAKV